MKIYHSPTSPFVRKVMVAAIETGQDGDIEIIPADPQGLDPALVAANAISKVPTMVTDDGVALPESDAICLYLDERSGGGKLLAKSGAARWTAIRRQALADGFMEAAVGRRMEDGRPSGERSQSSVDKLGARMSRILDAMEAEAASMDAGTADLGAIAVACALGYADFRYQDIAWRDTRPALAAFCQTFTSRPSMQSTAVPS
ncbi:MAG: glutathione S-transferase family protein [Alphaproteobacteria bacterium]|jgi:glutathione S-transferase